MADQQQFCSGRVSVMAIANSVCDLWLSNKSVASLLRCTDRPDVSARLGQVLEDSFGSSAGAICDANSFGLAEVLLRHLLEAVHMPIPLGEDILCALVRIASEELRKDDAFHQLIAPPHVAPGTLDKRRGSKLFGYQEMPIGKSCDASAYAATTADSLDFLTSWESEDSDSECSAGDGIGGSTIVFDWDNVLMPTWWIAHVLAPELSNLDAVNPWSPNESRMLVLQAEDELSREDSEFRGALEEHARAFVATLRAARDVADVAIVTLATPAWFERSFAFLPGLDAQSLFEELEIRVVFPKGPQGSEAGAAVKRQAMTEILGNTADLLWIGSQNIERVAPEEWAGPISVAKTIGCEPALEDLTQQLRQLEPEFGRLLAHSMPFARDTRA